MPAGAAHGIRTPAAGDDPPSSFASGGPRCCLMLADQIARRNESQNRVKAQPAQMFRAWVQARSRMKERHYRGRARERETHTDGAGS